MSTAQELLKRVAITETAIPRKIVYQDNDGNDCEETFKLARFADVGDLDDFYRKMDSRDKQRTAAKGKLAVILAKEAIEPYLSQIKKTKKLPDDKLEVYLTSKTTIGVATAIECGVRDPEFSWGDAVLLTMVNGPLAFELSAAIMKVNGMEAKEEAKKDSTPTEDEPEDSELS
jgi:hypothetical protein